MSSPRSLRLAFALFAVMMALGCAHPPPHAPAPTSWVNEVLGGDADGLLVVRTGIAAKDPAYAPLFADTAEAETPNAKIVTMLLRSIRSAEVWMIADGPTLADSTLLFALHASDHPLVPAIRDPLIVAAFGSSAGMALPGGITEYVAERGDRRIGVYLYPSGTVVGAMGRATERLARHVRQDPTEPPPTDYEGPVLVAGYLGPEAMDRPAVHGPPLRARESSWFVVGPGSRGDIWVNSAFEDAPSAEAARVKLEGLEQRLRGAYARQLAACHTADSLKVVFGRDDSTLTLRLTNVPAALLDLKRGCAASRTVSSIANH